jgi:hypothetical protein
LPTSEPVSDAAVIVTGLAMPTWRVSNAPVTDDTDTKSAVILSGKEVPLMLKLALALPS